jgi:hypothetical protein
MTIGHGILFFIATYIQIFLLGFQSRNVNSGQYFMAGFTAFLIGAVSIFCIKSIAISNPAALFFITSMAAPLGIMSAMFLHRHIFKKKK